MSENGAPATPECATRNDGYFAEWNGEEWKSVFPAAEAQHCQVHPSAQDAIEYIQTIHPDAEVRIAGVKPGDLIFPSCGSTSLTVECKTWVTVEAGHPVSFDEEDVGYAEIIPGARVCKHCQHTWQSD